jgi:phosphoribosyl 1,2-cyclic phosphodiesterase
MSLFITSLNSGSNGNCYYIGNEKEAILVDAGISCRETEKRMKRLGLAIEKVKAVFVSHEHSDHIRGICGLVKKYNIPIYITPTTLTSCGFAIENNLATHFKAHVPIFIGDLIITAFPKLHDASDPYSFIIECGEIKVGVFTDIGSPCLQLIRYFQECNAAFLEANYDDKMLELGNYPAFLKKRISGGNGHLSNSQAFELFKTHKPAFMSHLILSHLSKNNNCPQLVQKLFEGHAANVKVIVASRHEETPVFNVVKITTEKMSVRHLPRVPASQLSFSFI